MSKYKIIHKNNKINAILANLNGLINTKLRINKFTEIKNLPGRLAPIKSEKKVINNQSKKFNTIKKEWSKNYDFLEFEFKLLDKMVIGLGDISIHETSILLHHIYGIPYIPGQAIKGVIRNYIIKARHDEFEEKAFKCDKFISYFGGEKQGDSGVKKAGQNYQGKVIFFDAFPCNDNYIIEKDVMTPHYKDYYEAGKKAPTDDMKPVPIEFLVVKNAIFKVYIAIKKSNDINKEEVKELFFETFKFMGIGAKTNLGYGFIDIEHIKNKYNEFKSKLEKEKTKNMSVGEKIVYNFKKGDFNSRFGQFWANKLDKFNKEEQIDIAEEIKKELNSRGEWNEYNELPLEELKDKSKKDKGAKRVLRISKILRCDNYGKIELNCKTLTPLFIYGANNNLEIRSSSIKGLMRFWWRAANCHRYNSISEMRKEEAKIFGRFYKEEGKDKNIKSKFTVLVEMIKEKIAECNPNNNKSEINEKYLFYSKASIPNNDKFYKPGTAFKISFIFKNKDKNIINEVLKTFKILMLFGGMGTRSRKGGGNFIVTDCKGIDEFNISFPEYYTFEEIKKFYNGIIDNHKMNSNLTKKISNLAEGNIFKFRTEKKQNILKEMENKYEEFRGNKKLAELVGFGIPVNKLNKKYQNNNNRFPSKVIFKIMELEKNEQFGYFIKLGGEILTDNKSDEVDKTLNEFLYNNNNS